MCLIRQQAHGGIFVLLPQSSYKAGRNRTPDGPQGPYPCWAILRVGRWGLDCLSCWPTGPCDPEVYKGRWGPVATKPVMGRGWGRSELYRNSEHRLVGD